MKSSAQRIRVIEDQAEPRVLSVQRGSLLRCPYLPAPCSELAVVVSNEIQNEISEDLLVVPLERRVSRLKAPFAVDLGRKEGMRELHTARCDWVRCIKISEVEAIERACLSAEVMERLDAALKVALGLS